VNRESGQWSAVVWARTERERERESVEVANAEEKRRRRVDETEVERRPTKQAIPDAIGIGRQFESMQDSTAPASAGKCHSRDSERYRTRCKQQGQE